MIGLLAVQFNYDDWHATRDAFDIRQNYKEPVVRPEWQHGYDRPEQSPAAYAIEETKKDKNITIRAKFSRSPLEDNNIEVRTVKPDRPLHDPVLHNVLGDVKETTINFSGYTTDFINLELQDVQLWKKHIGVGIHDVEWCWEYRTKPTELWKPTGPWTRFETTKHRIFTVLEMPKLPWEQRPHTYPYDGSVETHRMPWTEVLDYACKWAHGAKTLIDAAIRVTYGVYNSGLIYTSKEGAWGEGYFDLSIGGKTSNNFYCSELLEFLRNGTGRGSKVDCLACAAIVSTFANILGCGLSEMGLSSKSSGGYPKKYIGADDDDWNTDRIGGGHAVAWIKEAGVDKIYDASLALNKKDPPSKEPYEELLPANMSFKDYTSCIGEYFSLGNGYRSNIL